MKLKNQEIKAIIFDWGDTIMRDIPGKEGSMYLWDAVEWIPYVEEVLKSVKPLFTCCIATSASHSGREEMIKALKRVGADQYFHHFLSSKELGYSKPDVRFFLSVAENINVPAGQCLMVGNLYEKDIIGAKQSGMKTLFFNENNTSGEFPAADFVIQSFSEFNSILCQILKK